MSRKGPLDLVSENFGWFVLLGGVGLTAAQLTGWTPQVDLPVWWPLAALTAGVAAGVGYLAGGKVYDLLPDEHGIFLVATDATDQDGHPAVYEVMPETWDELEVVDGSLSELPEAPVRAYEVRHYDPDRNEAVGNWVGTKTGSELRSSLDAVREVRGDLETLARRGEALRNRMAGVVRRLDRRRAKAHNDALEGHTMPSLDSTVTVDDVLDEVLPDDLDGADDAEERGGDVDLLDGGDDPLADLAPEPDEAAADGGEVEDGGE